MSEQPLTLEQRLERMEHNYEVLHASFVVLVHELQLWSAAQQKAERLRAVIAAPPGEQVQ